mgnify:CR=1 FL=1
MAVLYKCSTVLNEDYVPMLVKEKISGKARKEELCNCLDNVLCLMRKYFQIGFLTEEHTYMLCLDSKNHINGIFELSIGTVCNSLLGTREIFMKSLLAGAVGIIIVHNHPSGVADPSPADQEVTKKIIQAGKLMDIPLLDHIIICENTHYSFREYEPELWDNI